MVEDRTKKKTRLYLIRHGETAWNKEKRYQGMTDIALSEDGIKQAKLLAKRFQYISLDRIYVSPLTRAIQTAKEIENITNIPITIEDNFREIHFGEWEGHTVEELKEKYGQVYLDFTERPFTSTVPGEGSYQNTMKRALDGVEQILKEHTGENVAIVSHGAFLRVMLFGLLTIAETTYQKIWLTNTSITRIDIYEDGRKFLITLNDKAHLELADIL